MKHRHQLSAFLSGVLLTSLVLGIAAFPTLASSATRVIEVFTGVRVYVDEQDLDAGDTHGNPEAFIYNGTTYVAVAAISKSLGSPVQWEGTTRSVYIGKHTGTTPAQWLFDLDYFDMGGSASLRSIIKDNLGNEHQHTYRGNRASSFPGFYRDQNNYMSFKLNAQYSRLTGTMFQQYDYRTHGGETTFYIYGDGELLWSGVTGRGVDPADFSVDITGVLQLTVKAAVTNEYDMGYGALGEVGLWT